jgi:hypothetical protein
MSDTSPVFRKDEEARVLFPALKVVAGFGPETEAATRKRKKARPEAASKDLRH